eukprot:s2550_g5.t1
MAALLVCGSQLPVENLEQANQKVPEDLKGLAMKYGPFRAAKLEGRSFLGKKKGGKAEKSAFGLGFDATSRQKETELSKRLDKEADQLAALNRQKISGNPRQGPGKIMAKSGFVAAALSEPAPAPKQESKDEDSSDEDLFAPGVTSAFGKGPKAAATPSTGPRQFFGVPQPSFTSNAVQLQPGMMQHAPNSQPTPPTVGKPKGAEVRRSRQSGQCFGCADHERTPEALRKWECSSEFFQDARLASQGLGAGGVELVIYLSPINTA